MAGKASMEATFQVGPALAPLRVEGADDASHIVRRARRESLAVHHEHGLARLGDVTRHRRADPDRCPPPPRRED